MLSGPATFLINRLSPLRVELQKMANKAQLHTVTKEKFQISGSKVDKPKRVTSWILHFGFSQFTHIYLTGAVCTVQSPEAALCYSAACPTHCCWHKVCPVFVVCNPRNSASLSLSLSRGGWMLTCLSMLSAFLHCYKQFRRGTVNSKLVMVISSLEDVWGPTLLPSIF